MDGGGILKKDRSGVYMLAVLRSLVPVDLVQEVQRSISCFVNACISLIYEYCVLIHVLSRSGSKFDFVLFVSILVQHALPRHGQVYSSNSLYRMLVTETVVGSGNYSLYLLRSEIQVLTIVNDQPRPLPEEDDCIKIMSPLNGQ